MTFVQTADFIEHLRQRGRALDVVIAAWTLETGRDSSLTPLGEVLDWLTLPDATERFPVQGPLVRDLVQVYKRTSRVDNLPATFTLERMSRMASLLRLFSETP
jgi:hypothetical protein